MANGEITDSNPPLGSRLEWPCGAFGGPTYRWFKNGVEMVTRYSNIHTNKSLGIRKSIRILWFPIHRFVRRLTYTRKNFAPCKKYSMSTSQEQVHIY